MAALLRCPNGHQWESSAEPPAAGEACPVCAASPKTGTEPPTENILTPLPPRNEGGAPERPPVIAGFEILEELGRGGMGIVYKARQLLEGPETRQSRLVALKIIRKERLAHPETLQRFRREAQAAARLSHPNVVAVYGAEQVGDVHYLAMEFVPGVSLQHLVEQSGPLPVPQACDFVRQAALGLQHAAEMGLVHRDVKPANLMALIPSGAPLPPRPLLKILDMGVARLSQLRDLPDDPLTTLTRDGVVIGTPDYVAPEQLEDPRAVDIRADLYSLGCTFYFLLSGQVPFPGGTLIQKLDRQRWQTAPSVDQLRSEVPKVVAAVVRRLMAKHPDDRYATPAELTGALDLLTRTGTLPRGHQPAPLRDLRCFTGHQGAVIGVACSPDGTTILSGGADRVLRLWELHTGKERLRFGDSPHEIGCVAIAPVSGRGLSAQGASVRAWDLTTGKELLRMTGHTDAVRAISISADGRFVLTGGDDRTARLWDLGSGRELQRLAGHRARVSGVALSTDGRLALTGDRDQSLRLWETGSGKELRTFATPKGAVLAVALSSDGRTALSGHFDTTLRLWEVTTGREWRRLTGHRQMVAGVAFSPDGRLASASHDGTVRLWDAASGSEVACCQGHSGAVNAVVFTPDGKHLLSAGSDRTIRLWPLPT
jgi:WD40 repeat protein